MSTIALPSSFVPSICSFKSSVNQRVVASPFGGSEQAIDLLNDRWLCSLTIPFRSFTEGGELEAFIAAMRGQTNICYLWHFARPAPIGTARGSIVLTGTAAQGTDTLTVSGITPSTGTLLPGDMLTVGDLLVMVAQSTTAVAGNATIKIANRLRTAKPAGTSVAWDKAPAPFRMQASSGVVYNGSIAEDVTFDFGEYIV